jgi:hypothetical protein
MAHPATATQDYADGAPAELEAGRAEALFASTLQSSQSPSPDRVRREVDSTLLQLGTRGCAERLACEFGDHPDTAITRMAWALALIRAVYPTCATA